MQTVYPYFVKWTIVCLIFAPTCAPSRNHCMRSLANEQTVGEEEDER